MAEKRKRITKIERTAYHEAGHAVMYFLQHLPFKYVTIEPDEENLGHLKSAPSPKSFRPDIDISGRTRRNVERMAKGSMAGPIAEQHFVGRRVRSGHGQDWDDTLRLVGYLCGSDEQVAAYTEWLWISARDELLHLGNWDAVKAVASELLTHRRIGSRRCREIIKAALRAYARKQGVRPMAMRDGKIVVLEDDDED